MVPTWRHACVALCLLAAGCADLTQILVTVTKAPDLPPIAVAVIEVEDASGNRVDGPRSFVVAPNGSSFALVPRGGDASRRVRVVVTGCRVIPAAGGACASADVVATQAFRTSFLPGQLVRIAVELSGACSGFPCGVGEICRVSRGTPACVPIETSDGGVDSGVVVDASTDGSQTDAGRDGGPADARVDTGVDAGRVDSGPPEPCPEADLASALGDAIVRGTTVGARNDLTPSCRGATGSAPDRMYRWTAPVAATYSFDTSGSAYDTVLVLLGACGGASLACNDDFSGTTSRVVLAMTAGQSVIVVIDGYGSGSGSFQLNVHDAAVDAGVDAGRDASADGAVATDGGVDGGPGADGGPEFDAGPDAGDADAGLDAGGADAGDDAGTADAGLGAGDADSGPDAGDADAGLDAGAPDDGGDAGDLD